MVSSLFPWDKLCSNNNLKLPPLLIELILLSSRLKRRKTINQLLNKSRNRPMLRMKDTERRTLRSNNSRKSRRDSKKAKCKDTSLITEQPLRSQTTQLSLRLLMRSKSSMLKQRSSIKR
jgi:hypothetical protein